MAAIRTNLTVNPAAMSPGSNFGAYSAGTGETGTTTWVTGAIDGPTPQITSYARRTVTTPKTSGSTGWRTNNASQQAPMAGVSGDKATVSLWVRHNVPGGMSATLRSTTYDAANVTVNNGDMVWSSIPAGVWTRIHSSIVASGNFVSVGWWLFQTTGNNLPAGTVLDVTGVLVERASTPGPYFDGSTPADSTYAYSWTGTPHASTSIAEYAPYYLQAEPVVEAGKPPRVNLVVHSIPGEQVIRVERTAGGETTIIPGARRKRASGAAVIVDHFPALGVPTTYTVYVGTQAMKQTTVTVASDIGWLQDPIYPDQAVPVVGHGGVVGALKLTSESLQSVTYPVTGTEHKTMGSKYGVVIGSDRGGAEGVTLTHSSYDRDLDEAVRELVKDTPILVFRPPPGMQPLPPVCYLHATFTDIPLTTHWGGPLARFSLSGNLVQAVLTAYRSGLATYADVHAILSGYTYGEVAALRAGKQYLDVQKDPTAT